MATPNLELAKAGALSRVRSTALALDIAERNTCLLSGETPLLPSGECGAWGGAPL